MRYCPQCGNTVWDGALFCNKCGIPLTTTQQTEKNTGSNNERSETYRKCRCPSCGDLVDSMQTHCPWCGQELTGKQISASLKDFNNKLMKLESETFVPYESNFRKTFGPRPEDFEEEKQFEKRKQQRIASFIVNYPVPSSSEDISEFFLLAASHVSNPDKRTAINQAWLQKYEQIYAKARFAMDESHFKKIEEIYNSKNALKVKKSGKSINIENWNKELVITAAASVSVLGFICLILNISWLFYIFVDLPACGFFVYYVLSRKR